MRVGRGALVLVVVGAGVNDGAGVTCVYVGVSVKGGRRVDAGLGDCSLFGKTAVDVALPALIWLGSSPVGRVESAAAGEMDTTRQRIEIARKTKACLAMREGWAWRVNIV